MVRRPDARYSTYAQDGKTQRDGVTFRAFWLTHVAASMVEATIVLPIWLSFIEFESLRLSSILLGGAGQVGGLCSQLLIDRELTCNRKVTSVDTDYDS